MNIKSILKSFITLLGALVLMAIVGLIMALPIKLCWNYVMPYLFNLPELTWARAWCLFFLIAFLTKSISNEPCNKKGG